MERGEWKLLIGVDLKIFFALLSSTNVMLHVATIFSYFLYHQTKKSPCNFTGNFEILPATYVARRHGFNFFSFLSTSRWINFLTHFLGLQRPNHNCMFFQRFLSWKIIYSRRRNWNIFSTPQHDMWLIAFSMKFFKL